MRSSCQEMVETERSHNVDDDMYLTPRETNQLGQGTGDFRLICLILSTPRELAIRWGCGVQIVNHLNQVRTVVHKLNISKAYCT